MSTEFIRKRRQIEFVSWFLSYSCKTSRWNIYSAIYVLKTAIDYSTSNAELMSFGLIGRYDMKTVWYTNDSIVHEERRELFRRRPSNARHARHNVNKRTYRRTCLTKMTSNIKRISFVYPHPPPSKVTATPLARPIILSGVRIYKFRFAPLIITGSRVATVRQRFRTERTMYVGVIIARASRSFFLPINLADKCVYIYIYSSSILRIPNAGHRNSVDLCT